MTGDQGLGHVVLPVTDDASRAALLHRRARLPAARLDAHAARAVRPAAAARRCGCASSAATRATTRWRWRRCPAAAGIVHLMIEVATLDDVGRALDRCARRKRAGQRDARPARQRPDGVVLRADAGRLRHRVRHRRPAGRRRHLGQPGDHRGQPVGPQFAAGARGLTAVTAIPVPTAEPPESSSRSRTPVPPGARPLLHRRHRHHRRSTTASPAGFACQAFAALSLDPPLVLFCPSQTSATWPRIAAGRALLRQRARRGPAGPGPAGSGRTGPDKFAGRRAGRRRGPGRRCWTAR